MTSSPKPDGPLNVVIIIMIVILIVIVALSLIGGFLTLFNCCYGGSKYDHVIDDVSIDRRMSHKPRNSIMAMFEENTNIDATSNWSTIDIGDKQITDFIGGGTKVKDHQTNQHGATNIGYDDGLDV
ncbi:hypothetical protein HELRODRAFT_191644 [Helobdella robusta]|uniref:Uncharacterized protein n=1 Tax=Helobdella robusta TaxID=6412 RepID=T1FT60_HELRO|nr:hypothetical protein HELRODRAFT_191644 [Helobdella robusta]ESO04600.1 hypothetical protein HELRODRAFT_191644 [Helobdella robusta]